MQFSQFRSNFNTKTSSIYSQIRSHWIDILIVIVLGAIASFLCYQGAQLLDPAKVVESSFDAWFGADTGRVFGDMVFHDGNHYRTKVHPLFVLITLPPVYVIRKALDLQAITVVRLFIALVAGLWVSSLFILLRLITNRRIDATLFSLLGAVSAAAIFWFVVPETYPFGSLSMVLALCFVTLTQHYQFSSLWYMAVSALTFSFTVTNGMVGLLVTFVNHRWKRFLLITAGTFCLLGVLLLVQKAVFPTSAAITDVINQGSEQEYILSPKSGGPLHSIKSLVAHTLVMPAIQVLGTDPEPPHLPLMSIQHSIPGSGSLWGALAVVVWTSLLGLGLWALFSAKKHLKLRIVLGLTLLGQVGLHAIYGDETFLYSLHFAPLLVILAALSTLTPARSLALVLAGILVLSTGINNGLQFNKALEIFKLYDHAPAGTPRHDVRLQMQQRPNEPWARGTGHVVLATPGSREVDKAYYEPGGSFSPAVGSFGVSLWLTDKQGNLKTTSDTIALSEIRQQLTWADGQTLPGILTETNYYQSLWSSTQPGYWTLNLKNTQANSNTKVMVVIRSIGPAGGPIQSLDWNGQQLRVNNRWLMTIDPAPVAVHLGKEGAKGWMTERSTITQWKGDDGWGYARFELVNGRDGMVVIQDTASAAPIAKPTVKTTQAALKLDLPDQQFAASLNAQVAHLMMGLVAQQTRPGEPTNYPLAWLRDGAYEVVGLARAGQLEVAKQLSTYFAENDFFGGFGPEADAPGLSIWTLEEVARRLNQPEYDKQIWPHIRRKAEFILEMLATDKPIHRPVFGPIVPNVKKDPERTLVTEAARDGLIIGRMDGHRPLLFVNAVSYRGLIDAASLADRVNQPADAKRWRAKAAELKQAWEKAFKPPESENDRTYISGLWPTWVAASHTDELLQGLEARWAKGRDAQGQFRTTPLWTYFDIAEAHQWLFLNKPDRVWSTLRWFWDHQASPGLYTWWEGSGEENTFHLWEAVRGWVYPSHVTPHYWTAAEMLLLQLDMLAYIDESANEPTVVLGAGIPGAWLNKPMGVQGLPIPNGQLDWRWDGKQMYVKIRGSKVKARLGSVFPSGTPVNIELTK
jgi:hypothetical protein